MPDPPTLPDIMPGMTVLPDELLTELRNAYADHVAEGAALQAEPCSWDVWLAIELDARGLS